MMSNLKITASLESYSVECDAVTDATREIINRTRPTKNGREFIKILDLPDLAFKGVPYPIGNYQITPTATTEIKPEQKIKFILDHGFAFNFYINDFQPINTLPAQTVSYDLIGASIKNIPQIGAMSARGRIIGAVGLVDSNFNFFGVVDYESN